MENKVKPWFYPLIFSFQLAVLALDSYTPVGTADYVFYFLPVAVTAFGVSTSLPFAVALVSTALSVLGFLLSPEGGDPLRAIISRSFATFNIWAVALLVSQTVRARLEVSRQNWLRNGAVKLSEAVRGDLTTKELSDRALKLVASYSRATVAALYLNNANRLQRIATVAGPSAAAEEIALGEGLVGQVGKDRQPLMVSDLPNGYLKVASSLGETTPAQVVLIPLVADSELIGVAEFGFLKSATAHVEELLKSLAEHMANAIRSARHKERLGELLEESQTQAEELQAQQEELRVMNEELEQQTRSLKESHARLENQQAELEQSNQQLEEQAQTLGRQKEDLDERNRQLLRFQGDLREKADELSMASQYKSEFLANMSHELRTPLNSSLILAKLLADNKQGNLTEEQVQFASTIYGAGNDLLSLINDILDLSKVEAGKMDVNPEDTSLEKVLHSLERMFQPLAAEKKLELAFETDGKAPAKIVTDRKRLEQILKNLLSNAIKFTGQGKVTVRVETDPDGVAISVTDTGVGIPEHQHEVIFEAFRQADGTTNRKYGGTGLGLSITRELAKLLGGTVTLQSEVGRGSCFTLRLPLELESTEERSRETRAESTAIAKKAPIPVTPSFSFADDRAKTSAKARKILIVEDDEPFAKILLDLARENGFDALVANTADEGMALAREYLPSAVLLDVRLPDHSGLAVLDLLKSNPRTRHIPTHMFSVEDFSKTALRMGAAGYMLKPVMRDQLQKAFSDLEEKLDQRMRQVLVAVQRESITRLVKDAGAKIVAVATANEALARLREQTFDCMIMDLTLPDFSGYDLLEKLSAENSPYSYPPVIVYTGRDLGRAEEERLRRYSDSIIVKGARSPERLLSEVTLFLHRVENELPPERQKMLKELRNRERTLEGRRILLVDDDVRNIFALTSALEPQGAILQIARNGREALARLEEQPDTDLVLMDIMMPEMDGYEATRKIRAQKRFANLPVIAITAKAMRDDQEKCLEAGANDYLAKPIDLEKLLSLVRVWMPIRKSL